MSATRTPGPSLRPALLVVGLAVFLVLVFGIGAALTTNSPSKPAAPRRVAGTGLVGEPAAGPLRPIEILGTPPSDVLDALRLPEGSRAVTATKWNGSTQYSAKMTFQVGASQGALLRFYRTSLRARHWSIVDVGPARGSPGAAEVLAQRASTDGWFWEVGVVALPTTFGPGATRPDVTRFTVDLYEMPDAS